MRNKKTNLLLVIFGIVIVILISHFCFQSPSEPNNEPIIKLYLSEKNRIIKLRMESYVCGVVAAEMPASFSMEALKAQALCARTYAFKKIMQDHDYPLDADLSDDITCCQAYLTWEQFKDLHPAGYEELKQHIEHAVSSTRGEIIVYNNEPIDALYHSTCGGDTESASDVWGTDIPYLQSVECDYCAASSYYKTVQVLSYQDIQDISGINLDNNLEITISERSSSGRAKEIQVNEEKITANRFRQIFNLPSTSWEFQSKGDDLIINSRGYGHGVGMCQYGANGMALDGKDYQEIITHYYKETEIYELTY